MTIKERLIKEYPLKNKIDCDFECYEVLKRRYVIFLDEIIKEDNIVPLLNRLEESTKSNFSKVKTLIVVGYTDETFKKEDLFYFNNVDAFAVFYLKNENDNKIYFNDQTIFTLGLGWKKIIRKFNEILK